MIDLICLHVTCGRQHAGNYVDFVRTIVYLALRSFVKSLKKDAFGITSLRETEFLRQI